LTTLIIEIIRSTGIQHIYCVRSV